ncbi:MAG: hypothetical protein GY943_30700 [Chloroflexi bacterium]|nr:hypothetical protein [Chloroflexota bacterium]
MIKQYYLLILFVFCLSIVFNIQGQTPLLHASSDSARFCGYSPEIELSPPIVMASEPFNIQVVGTWADACRPSYDSYEIDENRVKLNAIWGYPADVMCAFILLPWGFIEEDIVLTQGLYEAELYIDFPSRGFTSLCTTKSFFVFDELHQNYLPIISK